MDQQAKPKSRRPSKAALLALSVSAAVIPLLALWITFGAPAQGEGRPLLTGHTSMAEILRYRPTLDLYEKLTEKTWHRLDKFKSNYQDKSVPYTDRMPWIVAELDIPDGFQTSEAAILALDGVNCESPNELLRECEQNGFKITLWQNGEITTIRIDETLSEADRRRMS